MWVLISAGVATTVISVFSIVAFLGRFVGSFTVSLNTGNVELALSEKLESNQQSSFLRINSIPEFHEYSYSYLPNDDELDNDQTTYLTGAVMDEEGNAESMDYLKYTFFVKNIGKVEAKYVLKVNIVDNKTAVDGRGLDDTLRVVVYENGVDGEEHDKAIYAKRSAVHHINENNEADFREPVTVSEADATPAEPFAGYAEMFETSSCITTRNVENFQPDDVRRYTIVYWLEGNDPQSNNYSDHGAPKGARIKLGVEINAYEN